MVNQLLKLLRGVKQIAQYIYYLSFARFWQNFAQ